MMDYGQQEFINSMRNTTWTFLLFLKIILRSRVYLLYSMVYYYIPLELVSKFYQSITITCDCLWSWVFKSAPSRII